LATRATWLGLELHVVRLGAGATRLVTDTVAADPLGQELEG
jgi:hypothetical protein